MHIRFNGFEAGGWDAALQVVDMPSPEDDLIEERLDILGRDGQDAGPDYLRKSTWNFTILVNTFSYEDGKAAVQQVRNAWLDPEVRHSRALAPLYYSDNGTDWYVMYGRPTKYGGPPQGTELNHGIAHIELQFDQLRAQHYSVSREEVTINVAPEVSGGLIVPVTFPIHMAPAAGTSSRFGVNEGSVASPAVIQFNGPAKDPVATLEGGWRFGVNGTLAWDEYLVADARAKTVSIHSTTSSRTRSAFSWIRKGSRLSALMIPPGQQAFSFEAIDPTFTASMTISWPHTYQSMQ